MKRLTSVRVPGWLVVMAAIVTSAVAQQTAPPGSPGATRTIDGKQLPPPPQKFGGVINRNAAQAKP